MLPIAETLHTYLAVSSLTTKIFKIDTTYQSRDRHTYHDSRSNFPGDAIVVSHNKLRVEEATRTSSSANLSS